VEDKYQLGWRLLYSPENVLEAANVAFIGLNPGGDHRPPDHAEFAMDRGSAYALERWPGPSKLQPQVLALFRKIGEAPEAVLAGNLVPFRSPSWGSLPNRERALAFGKEIWRDIFANVAPRLVICMGTEVAAALAEILDVRRTEHVSVGWGNVSGEWGKYAGGRFVRIPHLSRFTIMTRPESRAGLTRLLGSQAR
jgi:hypothetical protein